MSSSMSTILVVGATGGIGEAFARRWYKQGKKLILTGRREERLKTIQSELLGSEILVMDNSNLASLPQKVEKILSSYPKLDTIWINSGVQKTYKIDDPSTSSDKMIEDEVTTNVTAPMILARLFMPHLIKVGGTFMITSSGLAFIPMGVYPTYCPTKAAIHSYMVGVRQQLKGKVNIIEIDPPKVATDLDAAHKEVGSTAAPAMPLDEYTEKTFEILDNNDAKDLKEVAVGFAENGAKAWRGAFGPILEGMELGG